MSKPAETKTKPAGAGSAAATILGGFDESTIADDPSSTSNAGGTHTLSSSQHGLEFSDYLVGAWKRTLEWRHFGGNYQNLRTTNTVVSVEEYFSSVREDGVRYLKWCFGKSLDKSELRFGYVMKFKKDPKVVDPNEETLVEWQYNGHACSGIYQPATAAAVFNFHLKSSTVVITYRILNANTMAVCIVELDEQLAPTVQLGNMIRVDPVMYLQTAPSSKSNTVTNQSLNAAAATATATATATTAPSTPSARAQHSQSDSKS